MTYAHVENGVVVKAGSRPNWRIGDDAESGRTLTDAELIEHGVYPTQTEPDYNPDTHKLVLIPMAEWQVNNADVGPTFTVEPLTPEELADRAEQRRIAAMPGPVTPRQAKLALLNAGLLDQAEVAAHEAGKAAQIEWEYAQSFERTNPLIADIGSALGLTEEQIDDLFRDAATR